MKTKFKDLLLYSLATIGVVALFISATQTQESHTTPESHEWEFHSTENFSINKKTGEVRKFNGGFLIFNNKKEINAYSLEKYVTMKE
jgi:hypothetical protein